MRKIQERRQKHSGEKGGAQGQRDGYIGVETQTRALGAETLARVGTVGAGFTRSTNGLWGQ